MWVYIDPAECQGERREAPGERRREGRGEREEVLSWEDEIAIEIETAPYGLNSEAVRVQGKPIWVRVREREWDHDNSEYALLTSGSIKRIVAVNLREWRRQWRACNNSNT